MNQSLTHLQAQNNELRPLSSSGYLVASIRDNFQQSSALKAPKKSNGSQEFSLIRHRSAKEIQMEKLQTEQDAALDEYLATLTPEQLQDLEESALISGTRMQIESYYRLKPNGGPLFDSLRKQLISDHLSTK